MYQLKCKTCSKNLNGMCSSPENCIRAETRYIYVDNDTWCENDIGYNIDEFRLEKWWFSEEGEPTERCK